MTTDAAPKRSGRADRLATLVLVLASAAFLAAGASASPRTGEYQKWIEMKQSPRGPFAAIKWFCNEGRVLPPSDYACSDQGQGRQHGQWSDRAKQLRSQGYKVRGCSTRRRRWPRPTSRTRMRSC